jgi:hypothetical protein
MANRVAVRASGKPDLTGAYLHRKGRQEAHRAAAPGGSNLRKVYAGVLLWAGVFGLIWLLE